MPRPSYLPEDLKLKRMPHGKFTLPFIIGGVLYVTAFSYWFYNDQQKKKQLLNALQNGYPPRNLPMR